jgi:DNA-binding IscR family transcriptional regulator
MKVEEAIHGVLSGITLADLVTRVKTSAYNYQI